MRTFFRRFVLCNRQAMAQTRSLEIPKSLQYMQEFPKLGFPVSGRAAFVRPCSSGPLQNMFVKNDDGRAKSCVESYSETGFVVNGVAIPGSAILLSETSLMWDVKSVEEMSWDSFIIFRLLVNKPGTHDLKLLYLSLLSSFLGKDILVVGTGKRMQRLDPSLLSLFKKSGVAVDVMDTVNACATFNVLNEEGRSVAAAVLAIDPEGESEPEAAGEDKDSSSISPTNTGSPTPHIQP